VLFADNRFDRLRSLVSRLNESERFEAVADAREDCTFMGLIGKHRPDIVLHDFPGEEECGIPVLEELSRLYNGNIKAVAITECTDFAAIVAFIVHGGWGYVLKSCPEEEILDAIRSVAEGKPFICPHIGWKSLQDISAAAPPFHPSLMKNLPDYVRRLAPSFRKGETLEEIADTFCISVKSAKLYRQTAMKTLGVHTVADLQRGLLLSKLE
jgi:DNA-binding NarL/FixJ family response regulator